MSTHVHCTIRGRGSEPPFFCVWPHANIGTDKSEA